MNHSGRIGHTGQCVRSVFNGAEGKGDARELSCGHVLYGERVEALRVADWYECPHQGEPEPMRCTVDGCDYQALHTHSLLTGEALWPDPWADIEPQRRVRPLTRPRQVVAV